MKSLSFAICASYFYVWQPRESRFRSAPVGTHGHRVRQRPISPLHTARRALTGPQTRRAADESLRASQILSRLPSPAGLRSAIVAPLFSDSIVSFGGAVDTFDFVNDPITAAQVEIVKDLLGDQWSEKARDGFLVISGRFVDSFGNYERTEELAAVFCTESATGRVALRRSLEKLLDFVGSLQKYEQDYPVLINDPQQGSLPAFPQLPVLDIEKLTPNLYRAMDSKAAVYQTKEPIREFISREGRLPPVPSLTGLILRAKPKTHWCSYERYDSPSDTASALQILPEYGNDCTLRATLSTKGLDDSVFVAFNGDTEYSDQTSNKNLFQRFRWCRKYKKIYKFVGYFVELKTQDHPELPGGGLQVGVVGSPKVVKLEEWNSAESRWSIIWNEPASI
jgi:hypothetical protein